MTKYATISLLLFAAIVSAAELPQVFSCGRQGSVGGLGGGTDLTRFIVDTTQFPDARCNDGTPAIFYYGAATRVADRDKWLIFLQGGGSCTDGQLCAQRWCSVDTNYGMDKMTSSLSRPSIRGDGFLNPDPQNQFGSWNRVLIFYCSSDVWSGNNVRTLSATVGDGTMREYDIRFKGMRIIDAVLDTLRNAGFGRRRVARHDEKAVGPWPDLDDAEAVLFAGSSAGGAGVRANLDRVGTKLKTTNPGLDYRGVIDASYGTQTEFLDFSRSTFCTNQPSYGCSYESFVRATGEFLHVGMWGAGLEESCERWHATNAPGTEWRCSDHEHVMLHHITTPLFIHQDMQDTQVGGNFVEPGFGTPSDFARRVEEELRTLPAPEEPRGGEPGRHVPQCTDHESFTNDAAAFRVRIDGVSYHDAVWNWWRGVQPIVLVRPFTGTPGRAPECP